MNLRTIAPAVLICAALGAPAAARADVSASTNWAGYAVHRTGVTFRRATGTWVEPDASCTPGEPTASAFWVGIGGYALSSPALFQDGTELDCTAGGTQVLSAWYEFYPTPSARIHKMTVHAGDTMTSTISVVGKRVTLVLRDRTRHETFTITRTKKVIDASSAEWIAEAPEECGSSCTIQPLTDFGSVAFLAAGAETTKGRTGTIASPLWDRSELLLRPQAGTTYASYGPSGEATPSALTADGSAFGITYSEATAGGQPQDGRRATVTRTPARADGLVVPPRAS